MKRQSLPTERRNLSGVIAVRIPGYSTAPSTPHVCFISAFLLDNSLPPPPPCLNSPPPPSGRVEIDVFRVAEGFLELVLGCQRIFMTQPILTEDRPIGRSIGPWVGLKKQTSHDEKPGG